ncbi:hypothetical protein SIN8267_02405 [Sinobacterium norvegicum]|uniref:AsmA domain-containing protein n=1 Tax=Sinobacterium norvegicum TaxID=1641715 RepID=A0ABN8EIK3_9GAMM|nr:hypothetical protein [Sinobacterium norvegicum]CAH0992286.1 hypothetical protein SIN8267_02405 [Sinobacterium norvegicum]
MSTKKYTAILAIIAIALLAIYLTISMSDKNALIKAQIENQLSEALDTEVSLKSVNVSLHDGRGQIEQFHIRNPQDYNSEYALTIADISVQLNIKSLASDVRIIDNITIYGAKFTVEQLEGLQTNITDLRQNVINNKQQPRDSIDLPDQTTALVPTEQSSEAKYAIRRITLTNTLVSIISEDFGNSDLVIADISLTNMGSAQKGLTAQQLSGAVFNKLLKNVNNQAEDKVKDDALDKLQKSISKGLDKWLGG